MKKIIFVFALILLLAACSENDADSNNASDEPNQDVEKSSAEIQMENLEEQEATAEVNAIEHYQYMDEAISTETIAVYAEIENTSETVVDAGRADITYLDSDGGVISVGDSSITPSYLNPGEVGYVSTEIEGSIDEYENLEEIEIELSPMPVSKTEVVDFSTRDENFKVDTWGKESADISVTGFLENDTDIDFTEDDTTGAIGIYDSDDNFIAAESIYMDQNYSLGANGETSFEFGGGTSLPPIIKDNADHANVRAVGIEGMDDVQW
ncbi:membrane lipoprotein lipid attachment site-containing protein [Oceanobacillus locisalsi]|uniref:Membrane lipoprotein lipid attachment site-containing protein n=1 Tax=Oceanobacillus locisalsi TaxID=546107 RepID=A0ABW3NG32_9BACI